MELAWSPAAVDDLNAAVDYVESELASPMAARRLVDSAIAKAQLFADVPGAGTVLRTFNGVDTGYRYMASGNWMVFLSCADGLLCRRRNEETWSQHLQIALRKRRTFVASRKVCGGRAGNADLEQLGALSCATSP